MLFIKSWCVAGDGYLGNGPLKEGYSESTGESRMNVNHSMNHSDKMSFANIRFLKGYRMI